MSIIFHPQSKLIHPKACTRILCTATQIRCDVVPDFWLWALICFSTFPRDSEWIQWMNGTRSTVVRMSMRGWRTKNNRNQKRRCMRKCDEDHYFGILCTNQNDAKEKNITEHFLFMIIVFGSSRVEMGVSINIHIYPLRGVFEKATYCVYPHTFRHHEGAHSCQLRRQENVYIYIYKIHYILFLDMLDFFSQPTFHWRIENIYVWYVGACISLHHFDFVLKIIFLSPSLSLARLWLRLLLLKW